MLKKEEIYVKVESKEQAEMFRKVLEAMGEPISACYWAKNNNVLVTESNKCWVTTDTNYSVGKDNTKDKTKITLGELIDLLQRKPLLISEDGVPLYEGDEFCFVNKLDFEIDLFMSEKMYKLDSKSTPENTIHKNHLLFSTKQAALEWIEAQKPKVKELAFNKWGSVLVKKYKVEFQGMVETLSKDELMQIVNAMEELQNG